MNAANGGNTGPKKIDCHLKPKILGKDLTTSELRTWCIGMVFFWSAQAMETRDVEIRWANFYDCMHSTQKNYFEPRMPRGIRICNPCNVCNANADHRTALEIVQRDHETKWPIHTRCVNLFKQEQKEDQSFDQWHIHLYNLGEDAKVDELTGRDWLLFLLIQSCKSNELRKKILYLPDNKITLENVLALARKYESTEVACKEKDTINNIFMQKEKKGGKATPSQPMQQPNVTQSSTNANAKGNQTGAKRPCNRCGEESTYEHRHNCPAKVDTCTNCRKKGHRAVICHNGTRLNANGQVASASATPESGATANFAEFQTFRQHQRQQQNLQQRHQQQQQQQAEECSQIQGNFGKWQPFESFNAITQAISRVNDFCRPTPPLYLNLKPVGKPTFRLQVLADTGATQSLISLSTATKHGCEIRETTICLSAANGTKIDVSGTTSLQVVEKRQPVHTCRTITSARRSDHVRLHTLQNAAKIPAYNHMSTSAVAIETWKCFWSRDGAKDNRNELGIRIFGNLDLDSTMGPAPSSPRAWRAVRGRRQRARSKSR
jgi:hypothetical protein